MGETVSRNGVESQAHPHIKGQQLFAPGRQSDHADSRWINVAFPRSRKGDAFDAINLPADSEQSADVGALILLPSVCCVRWRIRRRGGFDRGCFTEDRNSHDALQGFSAKQVQRLSPRQDHRLFGDGAKLASIGHDGAKQTAGGNELNSGSRAKPVVAFFHGATRQTKLDCFGRLWTKGRPCE